MGKVYSKEEIEEGIKKIYRVVLQQAGITPYYVIGLAMASWFVDAYDFSALSLGAASFKATFPWMSSWLFGFAMSSVQIGATVGALLGGWLTDRLGRRTMFILNMILFTIMAIGAGLAPDPYTFSAFRIALGFALGADIVTSFTYIFEYLEVRRRLVFSNSIDAWWFGSVVFAALFIYLPLYYVLHTLTSHWFWRITMFVGGVAAFIIFLLRSKMPESVLWLAYQGKLATAKRIIKQVYGIDLPDVPDVDVELRKVARGFRSFFRIFRRSKWKELVSCFVGSFEGAFEYYSWGFYFPYIILVFAHLGAISTIVASTIMNIAGLIAGVVTALLTLRLGTKNLYVIGAFGTGLSMLAAAFVLPAKILPLIILFASTFLFLHVIGPMGSQTFTMINAYFGPSERGTAGGWNYFFTKLAAVISAFWAPTLFATIGVINTLYALSAFAIVTAIIGLVLAPDARTYRPEEEKEALGT